MHRIISFALIFITLPLLAQEKITVETIWKKYAFFGRSVEGFTAMKDGIHFTKFSDDGGQAAISKYKIADYKGSGEVLVRLSDLQVDGTQLEIDDYSFNADETKLLLTTRTQSVYRRSYVAEHYIYNLSDKQLEALDMDRAPQTLARFSPDGKSVAYIHANNLYIKELATGTVKQVTTDGYRNAIINGTTDWVYEEEFAFTEAYGWSADSKTIAYLKFDESDVREFTMSYYHELYPSLYTFKYPKAGEDNSKVSAHIYQVENGAHTQINLGNYEYIPRLKWSATAPVLIVQTLNRHQNEVNYHRVVWDGKTASSSVFYTDKSDTYVEIDDNLIFMKDGKSILRTSEKSGFNHIYRVGFDGTEQQITKGDWDVIEFKGIDPANDFIYYTAAKQGAIHRGVYKISVSGKKDIAISAEQGQNDADFTTGMKYFVRSHSTANTPPQYTLCDNSGKVIALMENNDALNERLKKYTLSPKEFMQFELEGRTLNGWMIKPHNFDPSKKYPVYMNVYGGPGHNTVSDGWEAADYGFHQLLAQEGYIVVSVDPRGTYYRGAAFKKSTYLKLGELETQDFIDVAKALQKMDFVDGKRIGIQGWSYGGFMTSLAMTKGNGIFKMGIAVAPVTNWRYYDNIYTERFMRTPAENASGYDDNSPIHFVENLHGNYFLIHGSGDDNVHYQNSMEMVNALVAANKQFDLFIYPNKDHGIYGGNTRNHLFEMILNYTKNKL